jgi:hypothetical protein
LGHFLGDFFINSSDHTAAAVDGEKKQIYFCSSRRIFNYFWAQIAFRMKNTLWHPEGTLMLQKKVF